MCSSARAIRSRTTRPATSPDTSTGMGAPPVSRPTLRVIGATSSPWPARDVSRPRRAERPEEGAPGVREDRGGSAPSQAPPLREIGVLRFSACDRAPRTGKGYRPNGPIRSLLSAMHHYNGITTAPPARRGDRRRQHRRAPAHGPGTQKPEGAPGPPVVGSPGSVWRGTSVGDVIEQRRRLAAAFSTAIQRAPAS
jgi:hypothetical protein